MVTRGSRCEVGASGSQGIFLLLHSTFGLLHFPSLVGTARCAVRAAQSGATRGVVGTLRAGSFRPRWRGRGHRDAMSLL